MTIYKNFKISACFQGFETNENWKDREERGKFWVYVTNTDTKEKPVSRSGTVWQTLKRESKPLTITAP